MGRQNGFLLPGPPVPQQPVMQIASPLNDVQVVSLCASQIIGLGGTADAITAVAFAVEIVAEAALAVSNGALSERLAVRKQALEAKKAS